MIISIIIYGAFIIYILYAAYNKLVHHTNVLNDEDIFGIGVTLLVASCITCAVIFGFRSSNTAKYIRLSNQTESLTAAWEQSGGYAVEAAVLEYNKEVAKHRGLQHTFNDDILYPDNLDFNNIPLIVASNAVEHAGYSVYIPADESK